jgi:CBS domain-containing protein
MNDAIALAPELRRVRSCIDSATNLAGLQQAACNMRTLVRRLMDGMPAEALTRLISSLNDAVTQRVIDLVRADSAMDAVRWCWIAFGSEGRQEQTLASDQDNGMIFAGDATDDALRQALLPLARRINDALACCGFPLCSGQIMASNPQCCLGLHEWQVRFANWISDGDPQALLNATIFFDMRPLYGAYELGDALREWLARNAADNPRFLLQMTENALRRTAPLGLLHKVVVEKEGEFAGTIDLKLNAATLFVDAARIYALACGSAAANTADRLREAVAARRLDAGVAQASISAFYFIEMLRLKNQRACYLRGEAMHNHVHPDSLNGAERHTLVMALRQARALQKQLLFDLRGSGSGL